MRNQTLIWTIGKPGGSRASTLAALWRRAAAAAPFECKTVLMATTDWWSVWSIKKREEQNIKCVNKEHFSKHHWCHLQWPLFSTYFMILCRNIMWFYIVVLCSALLWSWAFNSETLTSWHSNHPADWLAGWMNEPGGSRRHPLTFCVLAPAVGHQRDNRYSAQQPSDQPPPPPPHLLSSLIAWPPGIECEEKREREREKKNFDVHTQRYTLQHCRRVLKTQSKMKHSNVGFSKLMQQSI